MFKFIDEDVNKYYEDVNNKYPVISNILRVHEWPEENIIFRNNSAAKTRSVFEKRMLTTVNDDALNLLNYCDGTKTTDEIIKKFSVIDGKVDSSIAEEVIKFLIYSKKNFNTIDFCDEKKEEPIKIPKTGSKKYMVPIHCMLEATTRCNLKCKHCYRSCTNEINDKELSGDKILSILSKVFDSGIRSIEVTGGELFMHPDINNILQYILDKFEVIGILTNGTLMKKESFDLVDKYKYKIIWNVSLDSYDENTHDEFRGVKGAYKRTVQTIRELVNRGHMVRVAMSITERNIDQFKKTLEFVHDDLKATWFAYNFALDEGRGKNIKWSMSPEEIYNKTKEITTIAALYNKKYNNYTNLMQGDRYKNMMDENTNCGAGWKTITIGPDGKVRPCVMADENTLVLGNIYNQDIESIMKNGISNILYKLPWPQMESCSNCENILNCKSCFNRAIRINSEFIREGKEVCKWVKDNKIEDLVKEVSKISNGLCNESCINKEDCSLLV